MLLVQIEFHINIRVTKLSMQRSLCYNEQNDLKTYFFFKAS